jgi:hypothetical protein
MQVGKPVPVPVAVRTERGPEPSPKEPTGPTGGGPWLRAHATAVIIAGCLLAAILSVLVLSWVPSSDPFAWIDWGQEIASSKVSLTISGGPSWKPFPVLFTSIFGLFGGAAPDLWLIVARTAGLLALFAAFRLGRRFGRPVAGILAAIALLLTQDWLHFMASGASEPIAIALLLWAIDRQLSGSPRVGYVLSCLAALNRPEFTLFVGLYAIYLWLRVPNARVLAVAGLLVIPFAWLVPPWLNVGDALQASHAALGGKGSPGSGVAELRSSSHLLLPTTIVLAAIGAVLAAWRRERTLLWLAGLALAFALVEAFETQVAYGLPRYLLPAGAIACVLAGVAVVWIAELAGRSRGRWVALAAGALVIAATLPWTVPRSATLGDQVREANLAGRLQSQLFLAVRHAGGGRVVLPCRHSIVAVNHTMASALAWKLEIPLTRSRGVMRATGVVFTTPRQTPTGSPPKIEYPRARRIQLIAIAPPWRVLRVTGRTASSAPRCGPHDRL